MGKRSQINAISAKELDQLAPLIKAMKDPDIEADDLLHNAKADDFLGYRSQTLLKYAFNPFILPETRCRYANIIMDRAPLSVQPTGRSKKSIRDRQQLDRHAESFFVDRALELGNESLAMRFVQNGAAISATQLEFAQKHGLESFSNFAKSGLYDQYDYTAKLANLDTSDPVVGESLENLKKYFFVSKQRSIIQELIKNNPNVAEFLNDFTTRVLLPSYLVIAQNTRSPGENPSPRPNQQKLRNLLITNYLNNAELNGESPAEIYLKLCKLATTWKHPQIIFPDLKYTLPNNTESSSDLVRQWKSLIDDPFVTQDGFTVFNRTSSSELISDASTINSRCLSKYITNCCEGKSHIFTVCDPQGKVQSVFEIEVRKKPISTNRPCVKVGDIYLHVVQHEGKPSFSGTEQIYVGDGDIGARKIETGPKHLAMWELLRAIESKRVSLNTGSFGETPDSLNAQSLEHVTNSCGYFPNWHNIDLAFQEFKKEIRRGASSIDADGQLVYDEFTGENGESRAIHLIGGTVEQNGKTLPLREMNSRQWLEASGLMAELYSLAGKHHTPPKSFTATLPPPETRQQYSARQEAYHHRYNSGSLHPHEVDELFKPPKPTYPGETTPELSLAARVYAGRIREFRGKGPYLEGDFREKPPSITR